ncbi:hypothetical protein F2Q69_00012788 [Brassica cretica]|uniref:Uncharacterized protein n=1 Tax=Brassica cretica TaxID=69181 RepID=A0A8S9R438_BRACR|nr:hypothetical protein F2Q69_00012788 [Brassica cretica]
MSNDIKVCRAALARTAFNLMITTVGRFRNDLEESGDFGGVELDFLCHWSEANPTVRSEVMHVLLKSAQSASREEVVEEMKER